MAPRNEPCHCFGVLGEAVQTVNQHAIGTARPKADEQWHDFRDLKREAVPPVLESLVPSTRGALPTR